MSKRVITFFLFFLILKTYSQTAGTAEHLNPNYIKYQEALSAGTLKQETSDGHKFGYIPSPVTPNFTNYLQKKAQEKSSKSFPALYDLRKVGYLTSVKDQGQCGDCWAFATCASMESTWKKMGLGDFNLSENNIKDCHHYVWGACDGGNILLSSSYLSRRSGPVAETSDPYIAAPMTCATGLTPMAYVSDTRIIPADMTTIKQAVTDNGALYTTYYHDDAYFNANNNTYYCSVSQPANHAVTLVGWDDNKVTAGGTGAWIIKNSWGTSWGEKGFYYISYKDATILQENAYFPVRHDFISSSKLYYYDDLGWVNDWGYNATTAYATVKYVAIDNNPIMKVGTWINTAGATVDISVYDNFDGTTLSGLLGTITTQTCDFPGYYTFDLPTPVAMKTGNDFYIKFKYYTPGYNSPIPVEIAESGYASPTIESGKCWTSSDGKKWDAIGSNTTVKSDLCINAYSYNNCTPPDAIVTTSSSTNICNGQTVTLTANSGSGYTYQWQIAAVNISGATNMSYIASKGGEYNVIVSDSKGCPKTSPTTVVLVFSVDAGTAKSINCNDSVKLVSTVSYPTSSIVMLYAPNVFRYSNIALASFGADIQTTFVNGNVVYVKDNSSAYIGCSSTGYPAKTFYNKIALIDRGSCQFSYKALMAQNAGAKAVIIINNVQDGSVLSMGSGTYSSQITIPVVMVSYQAGDSIKSLITKNGYAKVSLGFDGSKLKFNWTPKTGLNATDILSPVTKTHMNTTYTLSVTTENCVMTDKVNVTISNGPLVNLGKDTTIYSGQNIILDAGIGFKSYLWSNNSTGRTLTLNSNNIGLGNHKYYVMVNNTSGCSATDTINVNVQNPAGYNISGMVIYDNSQSTPVTNTYVYLTDIQNNILKNAITDMTGQFSITGVQNGNYIISSAPSKQWGGVDPLDALLINRYYINLFNTSDALATKAADVSSDGTVNPQDALMINRRYISSIYSFNVKDWVSEIIGITINNSDLNQNIKVICAGDINNSYTPPK